MKKIKRNERTSVITHILTSNPNYIFTYNYFSEMLNAAKSTISEDITIVKSIIEELELGFIETISGAAGGVRFIPGLSEDTSRSFLESLCVRIDNGERIVPGDFLYMIDILYNPSISKNLGKIFAKKYVNKNINYVVTVETKGIPMALMTAHILNVPLVIIRNRTKITEGPTVSINYVTGSAKKVQTMSLAKKAMRENSRVLLIDDFMKAGGTAKGMIDMMNEFKAEVVGIGVFISTLEPKKKLVSEYTALLTLSDINADEKKVYIKVNERNFE